MKPPRSPIVPPPKQIIKIFRPKVSYSTILFMVERKYFSDLAASPLHTFTTSKESLNQSNVTVASVEQVEVLKGRMAKQSIVQNVEDGGLSQKVIF